MQYTNCSTAQVVQICLSQYKAKASYLTNLKRDTLQMIQLAINMQLSQPKQHFSVKQLQSLRLNIQLTLESQIETLTLKQRTIRLSIQMKKSVKELSPMVHILITFLSVITTGLLTQIFKIIPAESSNWVYIVVFAGCFLFYLIVAISVIKIRCLRRQDKQMQELEEWSKYRDNFLK